MEQFESSPFQMTKFTESDVTRPNNMMRITNKNSEGEEGGGDVFCEFHIIYFYTSFC